MFPSSSSKSTLDLGHKSKCEFESESEFEPFNKFFLDGLLVQERDLQELKTMVDTHSVSTTQCLQELVGRVMTHYEDFYRSRTKSIRENVLLMLTPDWLSKLEDAFLWIGGWRPTTAVHLLYSKAGLQLEARLGDDRVNTEDDLGNLSLSQLVRVDELQRRTIAEEKKLSESLASHQETIADSTMVGLLDNPETEFVARTESDSVKERVYSALAPKENGLVGILREADDLRLRTLKSVVDILSPIQAVHFLIADTQLYLRVHEWGKLKDEHNKSLQEPHGDGGPWNVIEPEREPSP
ncbi:protein DOG1-like 3 [Spinacia oleracea]|uniref:Protein DOG1-like 3 n=1 Tax=Spinacia oleracea TaxID=3562 RepID=A0A9R0HYL0_SPIOL|nr:protein DOG1-like 3 [Spinacia oleracea]